MGDSIWAENKTILVYKIIKIAQNETIVKRILEKTEETRFFFLYVLHGRCDDKNCPLNYKNSIILCENWLKMK